jgi:hypothetical protein
MGARELWAAGAIYEHGLAYQRRVWPSAAVPIWDGVRGPGVPLSRAPSGQYRCENTRYPPDELYDGHASVQTQSHDSPTRRRRTDRAAQTHRNECRRWVSLKGRVRNPWSAGSARCVLRDDRFRGLLRMRNSSMPSKSYPHPEERPKGASRGTQARYAALHLNSRPAFRLNLSYKGTTG